jgi:predicted transcriptional regulator of viral defense system
VKTIDLLDRLRRYPVFDRETFAMLADLEPPSASSRLSRLVDEDRVVRLWRDTYTVLDDPLRVATHLVFPGYVSLWYALSHHGWTLQVPHEISVLTTARTYRRSIEFKGVRITFTTIPSTLLFGYHKQTLGGSEVFMATPEKAVVDALALKRISPSEVFDVLASNRETMDVSRMVEYVRRTGNGSLAKRLGYMLTVLGYDVAGGMEDLIYPTIVALDTTLPRKGTIDSRWGLLDNVGLVA